MATGRQFLFMPSIRRILTQSGLVAGWSGLCGTYTVTTIFGRYSIFQGGKCQTTVICIGFAALVPIPARSSYWAPNGVNGPVD